ncbi:MAG: hypothetical protein ACLGHG_01490 [Gammaproteobacteria bacterium]
MRPLLALLLAGAGLAQATPPTPSLTTDDCYSEVSTAAEVLQVCLVNQTHENECLPDRQTLEAQAKVCLQIGGSQDRIDLARQIGAALIEGDPAQSPYQQMLARKREATRLLRVNEDRFRTRFSKTLNYLPQVVEQTFDTRSCPLAFEGTGQNYLMSGLAIVKRQGEQALPQLNVTEEEQTHLFFARMVRGKCYRPDSTALTPQTRVEPDQPYYIYNFSQSLIAQLPEEGKPILIEELRKGAPDDKPFRIGKPLTVKVKHYPTFLQGKVHRNLCDTPLACLKLRARLIDDYVAYNRALREKNQATACLIYLDPNRSGEISIDQLYGMDCTAANGNRLLAESSRRITEIGARLFR